MVLAEGLDARGSDSGTNQEEVSQVVQTLQVPNGSVADARGPSSMTALPPPPA